MIRYSQQKIEMLPLIAKKAKNICYNLLKGI